MFFKITELMVNLPSTRQAAEQPAEGAGCGCSWTVTMTMDPEGCTWVTEDATGYARKVEGGMLALLREQLQMAVATPA